jgi:hypothetical protein
MKTGTLHEPTQTLPALLQEQIQKNFPDQALSDLSIKYYESVADVGYEYFTQTVLPKCEQDPDVEYLESFISFPRLGEALILSQAGTVVYDNDSCNDKCTETGPFWFVTLKRN